ncbi:MAG: response regulator transcription factor [Zoogloea sp.]|nr:response regulator transcription factor [Zoogloea sp.]
MKILIVDDHPLVRQGLKQTIDAVPDMTVAAEARDASEALAALRGGMCNVVILDINLPDRTGLDVLQELRKFNGKLPVLVLSIHPERALAIRCLKAGANGFLNKESAPEELVRAVRKIANGGTYVSSALADMLALEVSGRSLALPHEKLSDREYQVMCLLASGRSISQIAVMLNRSPNTISTYRARILDKMGMDSNAELTRYAVASQLIA